MVIQGGLKGLYEHKGYLKRQELSKPVLDEFFAWAVSLNAAPKTGIGIAAHYALSQRKTSNAICWTDDW